MTQALFLLLSLTAFNLWPESTNAAPNDKAPSEIPKVIVTAVDGGTFLLDPAKITKPTLVVFWATWCAPCLREIPALKKLHEDYPELIDIIAISVDSDRNKAKSFVDTQKLTYRNLVDDNGKVGELFGVVRTPTLFVVEPQGKIIASGSRLSALTRPLLSMIKKTPGTTTPSITRDAVLMGTEISLVVLSSDNNAANSAIDAALAEIKRVEDLMTDWRESELSTINQTAAQKAIKIDGEILFLVKKSIEMSELTAGAFDISYGPVGALWDFTKKEGTPPDDEAIQSALKLVGYNHIQLNANDSTIFFKKPGMRIGLGGIAKGYAVDRAIKVLEKKGMKDFALRAGGDLAVRGTNKGELWRVAIQSPRDKSKNFAVLPISNGAVATSGDSERFFMYKDKRYAHIIDPRTGYPADKCQNVTIIAKKGYYADALATAVFILGPIQGMKVVESLPDTEGVIIDASGNIHVSSGLAKKAQKKRHTAQS